MGGQEPTPEEPPPVPKGVEVLARGPIHEAFATPTAEAIATKPVPKQPPKPLDEMPPAEKPDGEVTWVGGYWHWDDERSDFIWVSGIWRTIPRGRQWVAGYWRESSDGCQGNSTRLRRRRQACAALNLYAGTFFTYRAIPNTPGATGHQNLVLRLS